MSELGRYVISDPFYSKVWREAHDMKTAYRIARSQARAAARCGIESVVTITRVYNGDNQEYRDNPITRTVTA